jgi:LacI family transcriptional regulator
MTVSLALRNSREVSAETRERLQRLARARGYQADPTFARLMHYLRLRAPSRLKASIAGLVSSKTWSPRPQKHNFMERLCEGLEARSTALGYAFSLFSMDDFPSGTQLERVLLSRGIEGVAILPLRRPADLGEFIDWSAFSVVAATPSVVAPRFHSVMPNHFDNMLMACRALSQHGYRRLGLAIPTDWDTRVKHRWSGGIAWQNLFGGTEPVPPLITSQPSFDLDIPSLVAWLKKEKPDAVISDATSYTKLADGVAQLPVRARPRIITMNWPDTQCDAGIDQRPEYLGRCTIDVLAGLLARNEKGIPTVPNTTMIEGEWIPGRLGSKSVKVKRYEGANV